MCQALLCLHVFELVQSSGQAYRQLLQLVHVRDEDGQEPTDTQPVEVDWD